MRARGQLGAISVLTAVACAPSAPAGSIDAASDLGAAPTPTFDGGLVVTDCTYETGGYPARCFVSCAASPDTEFELEIQWNYCSPAPEYWGHCVCAEGYMICDGAAFGPPEFPDGSTWGHPYAMYECFPGRDAGPDAGTSGDGGPNVDAATTDAR